MTGHFGLFFLTALWGLIFGIWSAVFVGLYLVFLYEISTGLFFKRVDRFLGWAWP